MILDAFSKLETLKKERNAIILAHYYQDPDIQDVADFMGDSLTLAKQATQTNAEKIINSRPHDEKIIFAPDKHLGSYLKKKTGRNLLLWNGSCQEHEIFSEKELIRLKTRSPQTMVLAHPECNENILLHSDYIGSTTSIIKFGHELDRKDFIIATEPGVIHQMEIQNPEKTFIPLPGNDGCACNECPHMRLNTLEKIVEALEKMKPEIILPEDLRIQALIPLEKMLALS